MAPFDSELTTKISPLIDGQVPDFIQADHPVFVEFLKAYYQFLESAEMTISGTVDQILLETVSINYLVLDGTNFSGSNNADRIVFESGSGTTGKFDPGETITGGTSKATSVILVDDDERIFIKANTRFVIGETITGSTTGATSTVIRYRGNPVQTIQQLLDYANPDNTVDSFFTAFRDSFMESIPESLADGVSKRLLIKQIKDLYSAKGTSEGHKLFFRILLGQEATIDYPSKYMMRVSDGKWEVPTIIRCTADTVGTDPNNIVGQLVTGASSGTIAQIISVNTFTQGSVGVVEFGLRTDSIIGDGFSVSETFTAIDSVADATIQFTVQSIVISATVNNGGILNSVGDSITIDSNAGNGLANAAVSSITSGSINDIHIEEVGSGYTIGDSVKFTEDSTDSLVSAAKAFVSVTGGRLITEDSTSAIPEFIINEEGTVSQFTSNAFLLNGTAITATAAEPYQVFGTDRNFSDTQSYYYPLYLTEERAKVANTNTSIAHSHIFEEFSSVVFWMPSDDQNHAKDTISSTYDLFVSVGITQNEGFTLRQEDGTTGTGLGDRLISEEESLRLDSYSTATDGIIIESDVFTESESSEINRIFLVGHGSGYSKLPTLTITSASGSSAELVALTNDIGQILEVEITDNGFKYPTAPFGSANTKLILGDISGIFTIDDALTTHSGNVVSWDSTTNILTVDTEPKDRIDLEQNIAYNEKVRLENFDIVEPGRPDHGQIGQQYNVQEEIDSHFQLNAYEEIETPITLENEIGVLDTNGFSTNVNQISLERDHNVLIEFGIRLEDGVAVPTDEAGKFLLDNHRVAKFRSNQRVDFGFSLEDETLGTDVFGEQVQGKLIYDNVSADENNNIRLEAFTFHLEVEASVADATDPHGTFIVFADDDQLQLEAGTEESGGGSEDVISVNSNTHAVILEDSTGIIGEYLVLDSTAIVSGDKVEEQFATGRQIGNNTDSIILEDSLFANGSPSYLVNEDYGNGLIYNDDTRILFEVDEAPVGDTVVSYGQSIKHSNTADSRLIGEGLETFITEESPEGTNVLYRETGALLYNRVLFDYDDSQDGSNRPELIVTEAGDTLLNEISGAHGGIIMILDGTDSDGTNAGDAILHEDDELGEELILNASDTDAADAGSDIILEQEFSLLGETISDGSNSGVVLSEGIANITFNVGTTATNVGKYLNTDSLVGPSINRIQDSYFYQQFSYEVSVGSVLSDYINELKRAVHPAGFIPFGKVSLASLISVTVGTTGAGISDYTGDTTTFTPEFASLFSIVFDKTLRMSHEVRNNVLSIDGESSLFDTLIQENGVALGDLILEETDGDNLQFESGLDIAAENSPSSGDGVILLDSDVGGRLLIETAIGENANRNRSVTHITTLRITPDIVVPKTGYGAPLASGLLPGSIFFDLPSVQLEDGLREKIPISMQDNLVLDSSNAVGSSAGDRILYEDSHDLNAQSGIPLTELSVLSFGNLDEIDTVGFTEPAGTLKTNEGAIVFEQSSASDELVLEDYMHFILEGGRLNDIIILESGHNLLVEDNPSLKFSLEDNLQSSITGTDELTNIRLETTTDSTGHLIGEGIGVGDNSINIVLDGRLDRGEKLLTEGSKIEFEDATNQGSIPEGNFGNKNITQFTREARISSKSVTNRLSLQDEHEFGFNIGLEDDSGVVLFNGTSALLDIGKNIVLEGTDSGKTDEGDFLIMDRSASSTDVGDNILLDSAGGRDDGDKLVCFNTIHRNVVGAEGGFFLLNGTDSSSTNAGDELLVEDGLLNFLLQNSINIANGLDSESGGLNLPVTESLLDGDAASLITSFDSIAGTFDLTTTTFDSA